MRALNLFIVLLCMLVMTSGCYRIAYTTDAPPSTFVKEYWHHNGIVGLAEFSEPVHLGEICPNGVSKVENWMSFKDIVIQGVTKLLYNPTTVKTTCARQAERASQ